MRALCTALPLLLLAGSAEAETSQPAEPHVTPAIRVTTDPPAELSVDGHDCGVTPAFVEVAPGRHEIVLTLWGRTYSTTVVAIDGEVTELAMRLGGGDEAERAARRESIRARRNRELGGGSEPWARRVPAWPLFEIWLDAGPAVRNFTVAIDPNIDFRRHRNDVEFESNVFGFVGFRLAAFPLSRSSIPALRGLGVEGGCAWGVGLELFNAEYEVYVESSFSEAAAGLVYNVSLGRPDRGITLFTRLGWQRTSYYLGDIGNDIIPPFRYESIRLEGGFSVALGTRHLLLELAVAYLATPTVGASAERAYAGSGSETTSQGGEVRAGLTTRVGGLELGVMWIARLFKSDFAGTGQGWGLEPTTRMDEGGAGIATTGYARDRYNELRVALGYRY